MCSCHLNFVNKQTQQVENIVSISFQIIANSVTMPPKSDYWKYFVVHGVLAGCSGAVLWCNKSALKRCQLYQWGAFKLFTTDNVNESMLTMNLILHQVIPIVTQLKETLSKVSDDERGGLGNIMSWIKFFNKVLKRTRGTCWPALKGEWAILKGWSITL